jgi:hypothetical protein
MAKPNRKDWRNLPLDQWNTLTFHAYFADMNRELFGIETYLPMRNWGFEQAQIKRALSLYGAEILRAAFDECFRTYRPTREFPLLTAGFAISYRINSVIPRILAERERKEASGPVNNGKSASELAAWL